MKAGGTVTGMISLLQEFNATVECIGVFAEAEDVKGERLVDQYTSLVKVSHVDTKNKKIIVQPGSFYENIKNP